MAQNKKPEPEKPEPEKRRPQGMLEALCWMVYGGQRWQVELAEGLKVSTRQVRRWQKDPSCVPLYVFHGLKRILVERRAACDRVAAHLDDPLFSFEKEAPSIKDAKPSVIQPTPVDDCAASVARGRALAEARMAAKAAAAAEAGPKTVVRFLRTHEQGAPPPPEPKPTLLTLVAGLNDGSPPSPAATAVPAKPRRTTPKARAAALAALTATDVCIDDELVILVDGRERSARVSTSYPAHVLHLKVAMPGRRKGVARVYDPAEFVRVVKRLGEPAEWEVERQHRAARPLEPA